MMFTYKVFIRCISVFLLLQGGILLSAGATAATATTTANVDVSLQLINTTALSVGALGDDPGSRKQNYCNVHLASAAQRLAKVCNITNMTFNGNVIDKGVVLGLENTTNASFTVMQDGRSIGTIQPGLNQDVVLNLAVLADTTKSPLKSIMFVPITGAQTSQLMIRAMTGKQLFNHINAQMTTGAAGTQVVFYKNGQNPLPQVGAQEALSSDLYLVVENVALQGATLPAVAKRIQVINLSNMTSIYSLSLQISALGVIQDEGKLDVESSLQNVYAISIKDVHLLSEVKGHTVPLLMMPRSVYEAGSSVNIAYAKYIYAYAYNLSTMHAGQSTVYYDLYVNCLYEPFEYLRILKYFDRINMLQVVVDKQGQMASGTVLGSMIFADVYGAYVQDVAPDLSWVSCGAQSLDNAKHYKITMFDQNAQPDVVPVAKSLPLNELLSTASNAFPVNQISAKLLQFNSLFKVLSFNTANQFNGEVGFCYVGNPYEYTVGVKYDYAPSFESWWWTLTVAQWQKGIRLEPVFYDIVTGTPILHNQDFAAISPTQQATLYLYAYEGQTDKFLGIVPVLWSNFQSMIYSEPIGMFQMQRNMIHPHTDKGTADATLTTGLATFNPIGLAAGIGAMIGSEDATIDPLFNQNCYQNPGYNNYTPAVPVPTLQGLQKVGMLQVEYPGYFYIAQLPNTFGLMSVRSKLPDMKSIASNTLNSWRQKTLTHDNWIVSVPNTVTNKQLRLEVHNAGSALYTLSLYNSKNEVVAFKQVYVPSAPRSVAINTISPQGVVKEQGQRVEVTDSSKMAIMVSGMPSRVAKSAKLPVHTLPKQMHVISK